jgi:tetratricopeptide (TPR) repeat protein
VLGGGGARRPVRSIALVAADPDDPRQLAIVVDLYDALTGLDVDVIGLATSLGLDDGRAVADESVAIATPGDRAVEAAIGGWRDRRERPEVESTLLVDELAAAIAAAIGRAPPPPRRDAVPLPPGLYRRYGEALAAARRGELAALDALAAEAPGFSRASARLAARLAASYTQRGSEGAALSRRARAAAERALAVDPEAALALAGRGSAAAAEWDWTGGEVDSARGLALAPRHVEVLDHRTYFLMRIAAFDDAIALARRAAALDPRSFDAQDMLGWCLCMARRFAEAIPQLELAAALTDDPDRRGATLGFVALAQAEQSHFDEAVATIDRVRAITAHPYTLAQLATVYATAGRRADAEALLRRLETATLEDFMRAWVHAALGDNAAALPLLERVVAAHDPHATLLKITFLPQPLRADPRFQALLDRVGFPS